MKWRTTNINNFSKLECINKKTNKHILRLSTNTNFINTNCYKKEDENIRYVSIYVNFKPTLHFIKQTLVSLQKEYDNSEEVNCFILNGKKVWLDKNTRVGLFNLLNIEKQFDKEVTTLWFNNISITIEINKAIELLSSIELYAKQCYDNTQKHYTEINNITSIDDCLVYDITTGYPNILNIQTT